MVIDNFVMCAVVVLTTVFIKCWRERKALPEMTTILIIVYLLVSASVVKRHCGDLAMWLIEVAYM